MQRFVRMEGELYTNDQNHTYVACTISACHSHTYVPKLVLHMNHTFSCEHSDAVWWIDEDIELKNFDLSTFFKAYACFRPLVMQPTIIPSTQDFWPMNHNVLQKVTNLSARVALRVPFVEQQVALFNSRGTTNGGSTTWRHAYEMYKTNIIAIGERTRRGAPQPCITQNTTLRHVTSSTCR